MWHQGRKYCAIAVLERHGLPPLDARRSRRFQNLDSDEIMYRDCKDPESIQIFDSPSMQTLAVGRRRARINRGLGPVSYPAISDLAIFCQVSYGDSASPLGASR